MKEDMFYHATPLIFKKAEELRSRPTPAEDLLWNYIGQNQLNIKFRRQHPASIYVLDFYTHKIKLAIEIDGSVHANEIVKYNDKKRQTHLESLGISFLRFSNEQVLNQLDSVLDCLKNRISTCTDSPERVSSTTNSL